MTALSTRLVPGPPLAAASQTSHGLEPGPVLEYSVEEAEPASTHRVSLAKSSPLAGAVEPGDELRYDVFPAFDATRPDVRDSYAATAVAVDLVFEGGETLSESGARDQHGVTADASAQFDSKTLQAGQWNRKRIPLDAFVGQKVLRAELVVTGSPSVDEPGNIVGYLGAVVIETSPVVEQDPVQRVRTTRGSHSSGHHSRGNTIPLVGVPHGSVFATPVTDARTRRWNYAYSVHNRDDGRPALQGVATSHSPSPWIGDRGVIQLMPSATAEPVFDPAERALGFDHRDEIDWPHTYAVTLDGGVRVEITAGSWTLVARFTFPGDTGWVVIDQFDEHGGLTLPDPADADAGMGVSAFVDGEDSSPRLFADVVADRPATGIRRDGDSPVRGALRFDLDDTRQVTVAVPTSFLGVEQARRNLAGDLHEAGLSAAQGDSLPTGTFDAVAATTKALWDDRLRTLDVEGATADQQITVASSLYRLFLFPNEHAENVGSPEEPVYRYASPFHSPERPHTDRETGCRIVDGRLTVNNGFWDTYRTVWPALGLLRPDDTGRLLDGLVQHYRDGGWTSRWTAPGPVDSMTGTTCDVLFADALQAGLPGIEALAAYDSALRNATVPSDDPRVGRKGVRSQTFRGFTDTRVSEGMSWTLDSAINDFAISRAAQQLRGNLPEGHPRLPELAADVAYYAARGARYATVFDERISFFQGRDEDGSWRVQDPAEYDPAPWGGDYTETNGWGTAFTAPHDGNGLATLHGGPAALEAHLDEFFATPETGRDEVRGSYSTVIHEMIEARDVRMGMFGLSNQPAHHIPFMYAFTGAHHKTQRIVRESLRRQFLGSEIGQGYPGDEDNGEMSAWYLFAALGLYPLVPATGDFVFTTPLFPLTRVALPGGRTLVIRLDGDPADDYIAGVTVDGAAWETIDISRERLLAASEIVVRTSPTATEWASATVPPSLTAPGTRPVTRLDLTAPGEASARAWSSVESCASVFDDTGESVLPLGAGDEVGWTFAEPTTTSLYTVTPADEGRATWILEGAGEDGTWRALDKVHDAVFLWAGQTRPFAISAPGAYSRYRLTATSPVGLRQVEFLADA